MRLLLAISLLSISALPVSAAISRTPDTSPADGVCDSHPCTFNVTSAEALVNGRRTASVAEVAELKALFDLATREVHRGDTIRIASDTIWSISNKINVGANLGGSSGYLLITTDQASKLPADELTRVTMPYLPLMPIFELADNTRAVFGFQGLENDVAENVKIRGLAFRPKPNTWGTTGASLGLIQIGTTGIGVADTTIQWGYCDACGQTENPFTNPLWQPNDIAIVQNIFYQADYQQSMRVAVRDDGRNTIVRANHMDASQSYAQESFSMARQSGGPALYENNHLSAASETIFSGGSRKGVQDGTGTGAYLRSTNLTYRYNLFTRPERRYRVFSWQRLKDADGYLMQGGIVRPTTPNAGCTSGTYILTTASGILGSTEPAWPCIGEVTQDGMTFQFLGNSGTTGTWWVKNNFELKDGQNVTIEHNVFKAHWDSGQNQNSMVVLKNTNQSIAGPLQGALRTGTVKYLNDTAGDILELVGGGPLPFITAANTAVDPDAYTITVDGVPRTIVTIASGNTGGFLSETQIQLTADPGIVGTVAFSYGHPAGYDVADVTWRNFESKTQNIMFRNNIIRDGVACFAFELDEHSYYGTLSDITIENNLCHKTDNVKWRNQCSGPSCVDTTGPNKTDWALSFVPGLKFRHNTTFSDNTRTITGGLNRGNTSQSGVEFTDNFFVRGDAPGIHAGVTLASAGDGAASLNKFYCGGGACGSDVWNRNIVAGARQDAYYDGQRTVTLCPAANAICDRETVWKPLLDNIMQNWRNGNYGIKAGSTDPSAGIGFGLALKHTGTDGRDIGADMSTLPLIRGKNIDDTLNVIATDRQALFPFALPNSTVHIACQLEVSSTRDLLSNVADLSPVTYTNPGASDHDNVTHQGNQRMMLAGGRLPLSASTQYWYRLQCGGDVARGSFTTAATKSSTAQVAIGAAGLSREWGFAKNYSRAGQSISGSSAETASATVTANRGEFVIWRHTGDARFHVTAVQ